MYNTLDLISNTAGDTVICIYELNTWKAETEGLRQQGQPGLQSKWDSIQKKKKKKSRSVSGSWDRDTGTVTCTAWGVPLTYEEI